MTITPQTLGIAALTSPDGFIQNILHDDVGVSARMGPGQPFTLLLDRGSLGKATDFLQTVQTFGIAIGWELNLANPDEPLAMQFAGGRIGEHLLIVGARSHTDILQLYEDLLRLNNEQINALRASLKEHYDFMRRAAKQDDSLYDEVMRLNNEMIAAQRALAKANVELERLNAEKNQFLGMAAHDLRGPLVAIQGYSELLLLDAETPPAQRQQFLETIHDSSQYMLRLVNDLLDVSVIEAGRLRLEREPTDLSALLERVLAVNRLQAHTRHITLDVQVAALPTIAIDAVKVEQVLHNLLGNALKYTPEHGAIAVRVTADSFEIRFEVQDQGPGIPAVEQTKLFQFFGRTSVRNLSGEKSSGLGLAIAQRIVHEHGGRIWVDSRPGAGATFGFTLPVV